MPRTVTASNVFPALPAPAPEAYVSTGWNEYKIRDSRTGTMSRAYSHEEVVDRLNRLSRRTLARKEVVGYSDEYPSGTYVSWTA